MKRQEFGKPDVNLSWIIEADSYAKEKFKVTLDTEKGKLQLADTILMLLEQGNEIRIGTDGYCLILEANMTEDEFTDACYQYIDDQHFVGELTKDGCYPDYYPEAAYEAVKATLKGLEKVGVEVPEAYIEQILDQYDPEKQERNISEEIGF